MRENQASHWQRASRIYATENEKELVSIYIRCCAGARGSSQFVIGPRSVRSCVLPAKCDHETRCVKDMFWFSPCWRWRHLSSAIARLGLRVSFLFTFVFNWRLRGFCWKTEVAENVGQEFCFRALTLVFDKVLKTRYILI